MDMVVHDHEIVQIELIAIALKGFEQRYGPSLIAEEWGSTRSLKGDEVGLIALAY